jgi:1-acyl-sn-glycerol-3-phosphate acyltransferase
MSLPTTLRAVLRMLLLFVHLTLGALLTLLISPFQRTGKPHPAAAIVRWWLRRACYLLGLRIRVEGVIPDAPRLIVANHISWLDIPVLGSLALTSFISKQEVRNWPLIGWIAVKTGTLFIKRGAGRTDDLKRQMHARLAEGYQVLLFPEGTTSSGEQVAPFYPRLLAIAQEDARPIQPVALCYLQHGRISRNAPYIDDDVFLPHMWRVLCQRELDVIVHFCTPLPVDGLDRKQLTNNARDRIILAKHRLCDRSSPESPAG